MVLRPTKSVSVLFGLGDPATGRAVLAAHHADVREAVGCLDDPPGARRGHGGHEHVDGRDLYRHGLAADAIYRASYQRELTRTLGGVDGG